MIQQAASGVFALADEYVAALAVLDPVLGTQLGVAGSDHALPDYSPAGLERRADLARSTLERLAVLEPATDDDRVAAAVMTERLGTALALHEAGEGLRDLNVLACPPHAVRQAFDLMLVDDDASRTAARTRLLAVPAALDSWRAALEEGVSAGVVAARRQAEAVADQLDAFAGLTAGGGWFTAWATAHDVPTGEEPGSVVEAAALAERAYADAADWLRTRYAPLAGSADGVGAARYALLARAWNGSDLDLLETWRWGVADLDAITSRMRSAAERLQPGASIAEVKALLDTDERYAVEGTEALLTFLSDLTERTTAAMDGEHFDIDPRIRTCDVRLAAEGSSAAPYYVPPSEDLARPGTTWYATLGRTRFPRWWLVSVWYHEAVPGHHLQCATTILERERLSRFQRTVGWTSGYGEGWALYAERLMDELGYFADPAEEMGFLSAQALRAARVVVDIGMHLGLAFPEGQGEFSGRPIDEESAMTFLVERALLEPDFARSEVVRYLGLPGQAISYKVGERAWLEVREAARARAGAGFDLKAWHMKALALGPMGLDPFRAEMARR